MRNPHLYMKNPRLLMDQLKTKLQVGIFSYILLLKMM